MPCGAPLSASAQRRRGRVPNARQVLGRGVRSTGGQASARGRPRAQGGMQGSVRGRRVPRVVFAIGRGGLRWMGCVVRFLGGGSRTGGAAVAGWVPPRLRAMQVPPDSSACSIPFVEYQKPVLPDLRVCAANTTLTLDSKCMYKTTISYTSTAHRPPLASMEGTRAEPNAQQLL